MIVPRYPLVDGASRKDAAFPAFCCCPWFFQASDLPHVAAPAGLLAVESSVSKRKPQNWFFSRLIQNSAGQGWIRFVQMSRTARPEDACPEDTAANTQPGGNPQACGRNRLKPTDPIPILSENSGFHVRDLRNHCDPAPPDQKEREPSESWHRPTPHPSGRNR